MRSFSAVNCFLPFGRRGSYLEGETWHSSQHSRLGYGDIVQFFAEILTGREPHPTDVSAHGRQIHVQLQNLILGELPFHLYSGEQFDYFGAIRSRPWLDQPHCLLCYGRSAGDHFSSENVQIRGPYYGNGIKTRMRQEPLSSAAMTASLRFRGILSISHQMLNLLRLSGNSAESGRCGPAQTCLPWRAVARLHAYSRAEDS